MTRGCDQPAHIFAFRPARLETKDVKDHGERLEASERTAQDAWVASGIIWGMIFCKRLPYIDVLYVVGLLVLIWLTYRAIVRINVPVKEKVADGSQTLLRRTLAKI